MKIIFNKMFTICKTLHNFAYLDCSKVVSTVLSSSNSSPEQKKKD